MIDGCQVQVIAMLVCDQDQVRIGQACIIGFPHGGIDVDYFVIELEHQGTMTYEKHFQVTSRGRYHVAIELCMYGDRKEKEG